MTARLLTLSLVLSLGATPPTSAHAASVGGAMPARAAARGMATIPGGLYRPLYAESGAAPVRVASYALDRRPVTRRAFLAFVLTHPQWRRGAVRVERADRGYLADWTGTLDAGRGEDLQRAVTGVSWFSARAFCASQGRRLPTIAEWELAALASSTRRDASGDAAHRRRLVVLYAARRPGAPGLVARRSADVNGVQDLHGLVWEWTQDFDSVDHRLFCASGAIGVADPTDYPAFARFANRAGLTAQSTLGGTGFRCAADLTA